jgi:squalene-hopene/tetraprenyl-beta-curcumene cyclase
LDFPAVGSGSDEWVTAYIGAAVAAVGTPAAQSAARNAWTSLAAQRRWSGGWGYMAAAPTDADSTATALRLAEAIGADRTVRAWRARLFLGQHQLASGGLCTYIWPRRMVWQTGLRETYKGWCSAHACVSANAAHLARFRGRRRLRGYLQSHQLADGSWRAYWWYDEKACATALAAEALATSSDPADVAALERAVRWAMTDATRHPVITTQAAPDGSPYAMALRLRVLLLGKGGGALPLLQLPSLAWLLAAQRPDGSWAPSAWLRFPPTEVEDTTTIPEWHIGTMMRAGVLPDGHGLFTTATVLTALLAALEWGLLP